MIGWQVFSPRNGITGLGSIQIYHLTSRRDHIVDIKPSYLYNAIFSTVKRFLCSINGQGNAPLTKIWVNRPIVDGHGIVDTSCKSEQFSSTKTDKTSG